MPTVAVNRDRLFEALNQEYTDLAFDDLCFDFGIELDDIDIEDNQVVYKLDIPANRYDLLCLQGIALALNTFRQLQPYPSYKKLPGNIKIKVKKSAEKIRPFVCAAVLRNVSFDENTYADFIELQDKLHMNICRRRKYASIGTHDLDTVKPDFVYEALAPKDIVFQALKQTEVMDAGKLMETYETDMFFKQYIGLIKDSEVYPVIKDSNGVICSLPPIVNGNHSKMSKSTKNVLIEVTALDLTKARVVLDTMVSMFSIYCENKFSVEEVAIEYEVEPESRNSKFPDMDYRKTTVSQEYINNRIGVEQSSKTIADSLSKMALSACVDKADSDQIHVTIPPTRHDILQACDIMEDAAVAFGFNNLPKTLPKTVAIGKQQQLNKLMNLMRKGVSQAGYTECLTFALCSRDDVSSKLRQPLGADVVHIGNPKTLEFQVCRTSLLPGILKTAANNKNLPLPLKLFEIQDCVVRSDNEVGAKNLRKVCAIRASTTDGFGDIVGLLDRIMQLLEVRTYKMNPADDPTYLPGRSTEILVGEAGIKIGSLGVLHPEVCENFNLSCPCSALELDLEYFH